MSKTIVKIEKGVTKITSEIEINAAKDNVWNILKSIEKIENFHPLIKKSYATTDKRSGLGAKRHCDLLPMGEMEEQVVEWEEGKSFVMEVIGGKMLPPYHFMKGEIELLEIKTTTKVTFTFSYLLKYGFWGRLMDLLLIRPQFKKAPPKYVYGLKEYVEKSGV